MWAAGHHQGRACRASHTCALAQRAYTREGRSAHWGRPRQDQLTAKHEDTRGPQLRRTHEYAATQRHRYSMHIPLRWQRSGGGVWSTSKQSTLVPARTHVRCPHAVHALLSPPEPHTCALTRPGAQSISPAHCVMSCILSAAPPAQRCTPSSEARALGGPWQHSMRARVWHHRVLRQSMSVLHGEMSTCTYLSNC